MAQLSLLRLHEVIARTGLSRSTIYATPDFPKPVYDIFMEEFGTPLWESIAALVEVALDLPENTIDVQKARNLILQTSNKLIKGHCP